jgi:hypothetical protein
LASGGERYTARMKHRFSPPSQTVLKVEFLLLQRRGEACISPASPVRPGSECSAVW